MTGTYEHALDTKSRLSMPARLREEIGDCFHLAMGADECLTIYPQAAWEDLCRRADELGMEIVAYTIGAVLFGIGKKIPWMHAVFHIFVILGSLFQYLAIVLYLY